MLLQEINQQSSADERPFNSDIVPNVLVLNPPNFPFSDPALLIEPIDVLGVATYIESLGCKVKFIDCDIDQITPNVLAPILDSSSLNWVVIPFDYHIPLFTLEAKKHVKTIAALAANAGVQVFIGGRPASHNPEEFLFHRNIFVISGEMEPALSELVKQFGDASISLEQIPNLVWRDFATQKVCKSQIRQRSNLHSLPITNRKFVDLKKYIGVRTMLSSRGCVEKCSFCPVHNFWGKWRARSVQQVVDEIIMLQVDQKHQKILFLDDHATVDSRRLREISRELIRRKSTALLGCLGTVRAYDHETSELMYAAGFRWLHIGAESGSKEVLRRLSKRIYPDQILSVVEDARKIGLRVRTSWILDAPQASNRDFSETLELIKSTASNEIRLHFLTLRAMAPLAKGLDLLVANQYIHKNQPQVNCSNIDRDLLHSGVRELIKYFSKLKHHIIENSSEWNKYSLKQLDSSKFNFVSLCPGRYGVGWQW